MSHNNLRPVPSGPVITDEFIKAEIVHFKGHIDSGMYNRKELTLFFKQLVEYIEQPTREIKVIGVEHRAALQHIPGECAGWMNMMEEHMEGCFYGTN